MPYRRSINNMKQILQHMCNTDYDDDNECHYNAPQHNAPLAHAQSAIDTFYHLEAARTMMLSTGADQLWHNTVIKLR